MGYKNPTHHTLINRWGAMHQRCTDASHPTFYRYGGRGITVCEEWADKWAFVDWAEQAGFAPGLELDRIDNDKGYSPENCRWVTKSENIRNRVPTKRRSQTSRENLRKANPEITRKRTVETQSVPVRCVETRVVFPSIRVAAEHIKATPALIGHVLAGRNKSARGLHWEYAN